MANITLRKGLGRAMNFTELDDNFSILSDAAFDAVASIDSLEIVASAAIASVDSLEVVTSAAIASVDSLEIVASAAIASVDSLEIVASAAIASIDSLEILTNNPTIILDGGATIISGNTTNTNVAATAPAILIIDEPNVTGVTVNFTTATQAGSITHVIVKDLFGDPTGGSVVNLKFQVGLFGNPFGTDTLVLQEGEAAMIYMVAPGEGILLNYNKAAYVVEYPSDGQ